MIDLLYKALTTRLSPILIENNSPEDVLIDDTLFTNLILLNEPNVESVRKSLSSEEFYKGGIIYIISGIDNNEIICDLLLKYLEDDVRNLYVLISKEPGRLPHSILSRIRLRIRTPNRISIKYEQEILDLITYFKDPAWPHKFMEGSFPSLLVNKQRLMEDRYKISHALVMNMGKFKDAKYILHILKCIEQGNYDRIKHVCTSLILADCMI